MGMKHIGLGIGLAATLVTGVCGATETRVMVRARSKDAKFIGTSMGGALVVIRKADTGEVLASGLTSGGTGDTKRIMIEPLARGARLTDASTAGFEATLDLAEPTFVTVEVSGPMGQRESAAKASAQSWLIPGKHVAGDGLIVEIPGFAVHVVAPLAHEVVALEGGKAQVPLVANVVMM